MSSETSSLPSSVTPTYECHHRGRSNQAVVYLPACLLDWLEDEVQKMRQSGDLFASRSGLLRLLCAGAHPRHWAPHAEDRLPVERKKRGRPAARPVPEGVVMSPRRRNSHWSKAMLDELLAARQAGASLRHLAEAYRVSVPRVNQLLRQAKAGVVHDAKRGPKKPKSEWLDEQWERDEF